MGSIMDSRYWVCGKCCLQFDWETQRKEIMAHRCGRKAHRGSAETGAADPARTGQGAKATGDYMTDTLVEQIIELARGWMEPMRHRLYEEAVRAWVAAERAKIAPASEDA
jgi:hypothetical protein